MPEQAIILAGGLGTRLGSLTRETPKPALDVGGRPFILWLLDELRRQGVKRFLVLAGFQATVLGQVLKDQAGVEILVEPAPLGTGGALRFAADHLEKSFFFLNGDSWFDINILALPPSLGDATGVLSLRSIEDGARYGEVILDGQRITGFLERPRNPGRTVINGGLALLTRQILQWIAPQGAVSIERDVYPKLAAAGKLQGVVYDRPFIDIGVPQDFEKAQSYIPAHVRRGAVIFDRDGVLNTDIGYAHRPDQIKWVAGAREAVRAVNDAGLLALVATNQAGVARGLYGLAEVHHLHDWMNDELRKCGAHIDGFELSPYHPDGVVPEFSRDSDCRKPNPGMVQRLLKNYPVDPTRSLMVGDKTSDVEAANRAGIEGLLFSGGDLRAFLAPHIQRLTVGSNP